VFTGAAIGPNGSGSDASGAPGAVLPAMAFKSTTGNFYRGSARLSQDPGFIVTSQQFPFPYLFLDVYFGDGAQTCAGSANPFAWAPGDWLYVGNAMESFGN
jgi:hypothetical protein